jgi:prevent-host-death family protein
MTQWPYKDAKEHFDDVVVAAQQTPQMVTKDGKPAVFVVDAEQFVRLAGHPVPAIGKDGKERTFVEHLLAIPQDGGEFERVSFVARDIDL